jgi:G:T-mismatch repair DNA endonuclease (very short patch repair protein)
VEPCFITLFQPPCLTISQELTCCFLGLISGEETGVNDSERSNPRSNGLSSESLVRARLRSILGYFFAFRTIHSKRATKERSTFSTELQGIARNQTFVFQKKRVAIFVDGDFWHGWRLPMWEHKLTDFWRVKLRANRKTGPKELPSTTRGQLDGDSYLGARDSARRFRCINRILRTLERV